LWQSAAAVILLLIVSYASFNQGSKQINNKLTDIKIEASWAAAQGVPAITNLKLRLSAGQLGNQNIGE